MFLLHGLRMLSGHPASKVGVLETVKYVLRASLQWRAHRQWNRVLEGMPSSPPVQPHLVWKLQRAYLQSRLPARRKLSYLLQHHAWMQATLAPGLLRQVYADAGCLLGRLAGGDTAFELRLSACERFAKEGELVMSLWMGAHRVAALAFTVHLLDGRWCAHVGCLQGGSGPGSADAIRQATRVMHGLRPKQAVAVALYAFAAGLGLPQIVAVGNRNHVYQSCRRRSDRVQADYDGFWRELGAQPCEEGYRLPAALPRKPMEAVASKRRSQYRRRHALEDDIVALVRQGCGAMGTQPVFGPAVEPAVTPLHAPPPAGMRPAVQGPAGP